MVYPVERPKFTVREYQILNIKNKNGQDVALWVFKNKYLYH